jgi:multidrug resistance efflux pump
MKLQTRRRVGGLLWGAGVVVAFVWATVRSPGPPPIQGIGYAEVMQIQAVETARIASLEVGLHDAVGVGEVVARLDPSLLEKEREVLAAELLAVASPKGDFDDQVDAARDEAKRLRKRAELASVEAQLDRLRRLVAEGAASDAEVRSLEAERRELLAELARAGGATEPESTTWNVIVAAKRIEELDVRIAELELRSALSGQVTAVHRRAGEVVRRGDPLLEIRESATDEILAWAPPTIAIEAGTAMNVVRADGTRMGASVVSVGVGPTLKPANTRLDPKREEWGVAVRLRLEAGATIRPEEPVRLEPVSSGIL